MLLVVTGNRNGMVSHDSVKVHKDTLTKPHVDIYDESESTLERVQAMTFGAREVMFGCVFDRLSQLPQQFIMFLARERSLFDKQGFVQSRQSHFSCHALPDQV